MTENFTANADEVEHAFQYYPHRRSGKANEDWKYKFFNEPRRAVKWKSQCERNVATAFQNSPAIKILVGALKKAGCPVNLNRNVVCESCDKTVQGGYDIEYNQIVVCKNNSKSRNYPESVLIDGLMHMYDRCVNEFDNKNLDHLACTEIRAANLTRCSFLGSLFMMESSPFKIKETHQNCVKHVAVETIITTRKVDVTTAMNSVLRVFNKCYNDLEPFGRRFRKNSEEPSMAEEEAKCFLISH